MKHLKTFEDMYIKPRRPNSEIELPVESLGLDIEIFGDKFLVCTPEGQGSVVTYSIDKQGNYMFLQKYSQVPEKDVTPDFLARVQKAAEIIKNNS